MDRLVTDWWTVPMTSSPYAIATAVATLSAAATGGLFFAFSTFVMTGLDRADPAEAIAAMRAVNAEAQANAPFLALFFGGTVVALVVGVVAALRLSTPGSGYVLAGAVLAVVAFIVTVVFNVPLNDRLDVVDPSAVSAADALRDWTAYSATWTAWNHVRTVAPLAGAALMLAGLLRHP